MTGGCGDSGGAAGTAGTDGSDAGEGANEAGEAGEAGTEADIPPPPIPPETPAAIGYTARACGFDLNDDGVIGGPEDCRVCNGVDTDPDGDGVDEDLIYIDADNGDDATADGSPVNPFKTIQAAWDSADGPGDDAEDILCFRGTSTVAENVVPSVSGVPGHRVKPKTGWEVRDFEFPTNPTMLVGWDADGDGEYPPFDTDDTAVLDGQPNALTRTFTINDPSLGGTGIRYLEIAHLSVRNYGTYTVDGTEGLGFVSLGRASDISSHLHFHDLELENTMTDKENDGNNIVFNFFVGGNLRVMHMAVTNFQTLATGSYFARGSFSSEEARESGPIRFQNMTVTHHGCDEGEPPCGEGGSSSSVTAYKVWGYLRGMEIVDNYFDVDTDAWKPRSSGPTNGIIANGCVADWVARHNVLRNYNTAFSAKGAGNSGVVDAGNFCSGRPADDVVYDSNQIIVDTDHYGLGTAAFAMNDTEKATIGGSIANVTITNNTIYMPNGGRRCLHLNVSNNEGPAPGRVLFANNTCHLAPINGFARAVFIGDGGGTHRYPSVEIRNNLFSHLNREGDVIEVQYQPDELIIDNNVFHTTEDVSFSWQGESVTGVAAWQSASGLDAASHECQPAFVSLDEGDLHLADSDTCAVDRGVTLAELGHDMDADTRPSGDAVDIGADERI